MTKLVRLIFNGSFEQGFTVSVDINQDGRPLAGIAGRLPAEPEIPNLYSNWQSAYRKLDLNARLGALENQVTNVSSLEDGRICTWLNRCFGEVKKGESPTKRLAKLYPFS
jgi:hypothetical protein